MGIEEPKMMLGNGIEITDPNWIIEHLADFVDFTTAAQEINPNYTRHHIHKEIQMGRVFMGEILIIESPMMSNIFNQGKKFYITRTELDRIKAEIDARPKVKILYCIFECGRQFYTCLRNPCAGRIKDGKSYRQTVEDAAEYFERFRTKAGTRVNRCVCRIPLGAGDP